MLIAKQKVVSIVNDLPAKVDLDEVMYRLYLMQKLESAENDLRKGRLISHKAVIKETAKWFKR